MKLSKLSFSEQTIVAILAKLHKIDPEAALQFKATVGEDIWELIIQESLNLMKSP